MERGARQDRRGGHAPRAYRKGKKRTGREGEERGGDKKKGRGRVVERWGRNRIVLVKDGSLVSSSFV